MVFFESNKLPRATATLFAFTMLGASGCTTLSENNSISDNSYTYQDRIEDHIYAGIGLGSSWKQPDTSEVTGYDVNDRVDNGYQLTLGMDLSRQVAVELHTADLGDAGLSPEGTVNYTIHGGSALFYAGKNRHRYKRNGLLGFGRVGLGYLDSTANSQVGVIKDNQTHVLFGAGLEYMTRSGLGVRAEGILFEEDARYAQLALVYRTGKRERRRPAEIVQAPAPTPVTPIAPLVPAVAVVKEDTCEEFTGALKGVNFHTNSAKLTVEASVVLDKVASRLSECDSVPVQISAHTDSRGNDAYNQSLSERRAQSVADYLTQQGIANERLIVDAFGETQPIDTNATAEGRSRNRRVELTTNQ